MEYAEHLRGAGLRVTQPRLAVLAEVAEHPHADVETIAVGARLRLDSVSTQAIYDVLHALTNAGLLRCIEPAGSPSRFELQTGDNHHHFVCRLCGNIADVDCAVGEAPCIRAEVEASDLIDEVEVTYWGVCTECAGQAAEHDVRPMTRTNR